MKNHHRRIRLEEIDLAHIVFFARYASYAHEAIEDFFAELEGGYARLVGERAICFSSVRLETSFDAPLRYGDEIDIETSVTRLGTKSVTFRYRMVRQDGVQAALLIQTAVCTDMRILKSCDMPPDVRALLEHHLE